jgi:ParB-like nuclease domain.
LSSNSWTDQLSFTITFLKISEVKPHEEIIEKNTSELVKSIKKDGVQIDPVIVDKNTNVALDGMHRISALKAIDAKRIMVAKVDYFDEKIKVHRWLRAVRNFSTALLDELKVVLELKKASNQLEAMQAVDSEKSPIAILVGNTGYFSTLNVTGFERFNLVREFDKRTKDYSEIMEKEIEQHLKNGFLILYVKKPEKEEVIKAGITGTLFPPKSTRHVIPFRPVNLRCPLELLSGKFNDQEAYENLARLIESSPKKVLPPHSIYAGRIYEEELVLYNP